MRISDWSSDVCSSDLTDGIDEIRPWVYGCCAARTMSRVGPVSTMRPAYMTASLSARPETIARSCVIQISAVPISRHSRSEEHTSELQSLMRISYAVFCLKKKQIHIQLNINK